MATLELDTVYQPIGSASHGSGTLEIRVADVDVYEANTDTEPADENDMTLTQTLSFDNVHEYNKPAKWILFKSAGAAEIYENGLVKLS